MSSPQDSRKPLTQAIIPRAPHVPVRARIVKRMTRRMAAKLPVRLVMPDGSWMGRYRDAPALRLHRPEAFYHRLGGAGLIGFGEAYQAGDFDSDDLPGLLSVLAAGWDELIPPAVQGIRSLYGSAMPSSHSNSADNAVRNISHHYDLSNELFSLFLDETMTYSSALFAGGSTQWSDVADAQRRKVDRLLDRCGVTDGSRVLEIGSGWGELSVRAARRGAHVDTITLSQQQLERVKKRAAELDLGDRINARLQDYRSLDLAERYDAIISVEMIEAVGEEYWSRYFGVLDQLLRPGGRIGLQSITMRHDLMVEARGAYTWIHKYIFPGGLIPSVHAIEQCLRASTGLRVVDRLAFGSDYAHTLRLWRERFLDNRNALERLGFDELFARTWEFYLAYSQAGFSGGHLDVNQFILEHRS
ncbi:SAM-dependent methyltransferase [Natronoglycomyces albus]|uniref:Class I SAM-dependent methyltransferase n=1 Tax=Natronoglycomyces albus TaxID=2811108 RepID=A0A895XRT4_9ACTN|nr:cyclopropane-fatty-acyl-phospholipid synthase family protein [Natronoglycomyces albus]QSB06412.1 class I SAM-dependent methyltransferase [Natronoglycomyces albus]